MLSVFGDESADASMQRVFAIAGVIGSDKQWDDLEIKWESRTSGIPFHATDCDSDRGSFSDKSHDENKSLYRDLSIMLAESGLGGYGFSIDLNAQRQVFPEAPDIAYYRCFIEVILAMTRCAASNSETVRFTFDMRREGEYNTGLLYDMMTKNPQLKERCASSIAFECSKENSRLQIGDLFAREVMKMADRIVTKDERPPRKSWLALSNSGNFHAEIVSIDWFQDLKVKMPILSASSGISREGYLQWLTEKHQQHNITNLFLYTEWADEEGLHEKDHTKK